MTTEIHPVPRPGTRALSDQQQRCVDGALADLRATAADLDGNPEALLALLRQIEQLHRNLQDGPFRSSLPADRTDLFNLLRSMEESGGWPYIPGCNCARSWICCSGIAAMGSIRWQPEIGVKQRRQGREQLVGDGQL